jgi:hypothetical protein
MHVDRSLLYFGWDIAAFNDVTNAVPVQYDADGDGSACRSSRSVDAPEFDAEFYAAHVASCADLSRFNPLLRNTNGVFDFATFDSRITMSHPGAATLWTRVEAARFLPFLSLDPSELTRSFPTADGNVNTNAGKNAGGDPCIEAEIISCTGKCSGNGDPCSNRCSISNTPCRRDADCPMGETCQDGPDCPVGQVCDFDGDMRNNVEMVFKRVETSGLFGPHTGRTCSVSGDACRRNADCPGGSDVPGGASFDLGQRGSPPESIRFGSACGLVARRHGRG